MKKRILLITSILVLICLVFVACKGNEEDTTTTTTDAGGYEQNNEEYELVTEVVTDEDGEEVTDKDGKVVTTQILKKVTTTKGKTTAKSDTDKDDDETTTAKSDKETTLERKPTKPTESTTVEPVDNATNPVLTTIESSKDIVPSTSDKGREVDFSSEDQQIIKNMLEVPYLYQMSYENSDSVPIDGATHVAIWMIERHNISTNVYSSQTVVLDLFRYFGRTVVNFKAKCNTEGNNNNITYNATSDSFTLSSFEEYTHTVEITKIEDLGNNNYYKVTADVDGAKGVDSVVAIVQKNRLDSSLGFSIKALKWS